MKYITFQLIYTFFFILSVPSTVKILLGIHTSKNDIKLLAVHSDSFFISLEYIFCSLTNLVNELSILLGKVQC